MTKPVTNRLALTAIVAGLIAVMSWAAQAQRIIKVPSRDSRAVPTAPADPADDAAALAPSVEEIEVPPHSRGKPAMQGAPRIRTDLPPPNGPKRTVLSAPPPGPEGPTPVRPTPRWRTLPAMNAESHAGTEDKIENEAGVPDSDKDSLPR